MSDPSTISPNNCFFCDSHNGSGVLTCENCHGVTLPTRKKRMKLDWTIVSFNPQASVLNHVHVSLLFTALDRLLGNQGKDEKNCERVAIRIGTRCRQEPCPGEGSRPGSETADSKHHRQNFPAVIIVRSPEHGKVFTVSDGLQTERHELTVKNWTDGIGGVGRNLDFWDMVNRILDLDKYYPEWRDCV